MKTNHFVARRRSRHSCYPLPARSGG